MFNFEDLQVESKGVLLPEVSITNNERDSVKYEGEENNIEFLKHLVNLGFKEKIQLKLIDPKDAQIYGDRAKYELEVLKETCFIDYILLLWRTINICKEESIPIGPGRGSAAGSLILYLLGCTDCDPIKHDLFFERFISKSRCKVQVIDGKNYLLGSLCDVDIDVDSNRREILLNRLSDLYKDKFCKVGTLSTLSSPILIKDLLKLGLNFKNDEAENYSKKITKEHGKAISIQRCYDELEFVKKVFDKHPDLFEMAKLLEGQVRGFGSHASAYLITNKEIDSCLPVERNKDNELVSSWDMDCSQKENVKLDLLGLNNVGIAQKVCELIGIKPSDIKYDDPFIYECLQDLKLPYGLFQIGAETNFKVTRKIKPNNIHELSDVLALARPGALSFVNEYCDTKSGKTEEVKRHPEIDKILSWTKGCLLYQEQLMAIANRVFGISLEDSDNLRRIFSKKKREEILQWEQILRDKAKELNISDDVVNFYWQVLLDSADYSFNRCIWEEELVKYPSGNEVMLKNVRIGNEVLAEDKDGNLEYVTVLNVWRDRQPCYRVTLCNGRKIITSINHKFYTEIDDDQYEMVALKDLDLGHFIKCKEGIGIIRDIEYVGERNTIDLEVDSEEHNFYCNGIVVSNSHSNAYAILSARTIYLKFKYPQLFFLVALEEANNLSSPTKEVREIARELRHFDIKLLPPDIIKSKPEFSMEDNNIRYGLKSIKGISQTSIDHLFSFIDVEKTNKFSVFQAAQNAKVNLGIFVTLIYCGALDSLDKKGDRSKLALEAQLWSLMTDKEKVYLVKNGEKYDYNLFQAYKEIEEWQENGKRVAAKTRKETIKKNIEPYTAVYKNNSQNPKLTTFIHEKGLLGYSYSYSLSDLYHNNDVEKLSDIVNKEKGSYCSFVAEVKEATSSVSKKGDRFLKMKLVDETEELSGMLFGRKYESYLSGNIIPKEGEILYVVGQKGDDCVWCDKMEVQKCDVAFKKGDLQEILN